MIKSKTKIIFKNFFKLHLLKLNLLIILFIALNKLINFIKKILINRTLLYLSIFIILISVNQIIIFYLDYHKIINNNFILSIINIFLLKLLLHIVLMIYDF